ncbi:tyrosine-type recombinase/integrase, partial [Bacteroides xylanisolvens]|uniref:tyrosine-type recombinase/integrase n=1 Tax=Bacteroides xylanisolvens TaxID=371601 RepID=UPI001C37653A
ITLKKATNSYPQEISGEPKCNRRLKKIAQDIGIFQLTTYTARHSFATVLKRGGAKTSYISESLGHSNLSVTEHYLAYFEKEERIRNAQLLTNFNL